MLGSWSGIREIPPDTRLAGSVPCLSDRSSPRPIIWRLTSGPSYEGFGRRPLRRLGVRRGRRTKASQGGNRGEVGDRLASAPMGN